MIADVSNLGALLIGLLLLSAVFGAMAYIDRPSAVLRRSRVYVTLTLDTSRFEKELKQVTEALLSVGRSGISAAEAMENMRHGFKHVTEEPQLLGRKELLSGHEAHDL